ncbi:glycosyltransferase family 2 protein [Chitinophaga agri]|uniref:Glycosyltransferase n=1 Tax=Chitinophaga agri TaxID=2703787 RepID=A0A6B9ZAZ7_9BACT|nr:glycosyltransferase [Chitinophaga agri]QHS58285.1 glycosyltransferase [Chitinophaga agri]
MNGPLVTIVLPTYNGSRYLRQSLDSCLAQTYTNFELLIVNDCSTDNTAEIAAEYAAKDARVRLISNAVNKRLPASLNTGFDEAKGTYYTWTSDDNYYAPDALERMVKILAGKPEIDLVYCDYIQIDDDNREVGIMRFNDINQSIITWEGCGACFLYKKEVHLRNKGYNLSAFMIEDYDFFLRAFMHSKFYYLPEYNVYYYRVHAASLTGTMSTAVQDLQKIVVEKQLPTLVQHISKRDEMLYYRKFAVYYAIFKENQPKMKFYLQKLYQMSPKQAFIALAFITFKKIKGAIVIPFSFAVALLKLMLSGGKGK